MGIITLITARQGVAWQGVAGRGKAWYTILEWRDNSMDELQSNVKELRLVKRLTKSGQGFVFRIPKTYVTDGLISTGQYYVIKIIPYDQEKRKDATPQSENNG
jgi:hypothetical protein